MKYLHLMHNNKFNTPYIEFLERNFNMEDHTFLFIGGISESEIPILKRDYINVLPVEMLKKENFLKLHRLLFTYFKKYRKIILHGLFFPNIVLFLYIHPMFLKKCNWIIWGGDLYYFKFRKRNIFHDIYEIMRKKVIRNLGEITTSIDGEFELAKKVYKTKAKRVKLVYPPNIDFKYLDSISKNEKFNKNTIILLGNSADPTNNHLEALDFLKQYKDEDIEIICPLSYSGSLEYIENVIRVGKNIYGDKFKPLINFLSREEYGNILSKVDICIMNQDRQQAANTIRAALYLGKKVYMNNTTLLDQLEELGVIVYMINKIPNTDFKEFKKKYVMDMGLNHDIIKEEYTESKISKSWMNFFGEKL